MVKKFISAFLSLALLISILAINPNVGTASTFSIDSNLSISPTEDVLDFDNVAVGSSETKDFTITNDGSNTRQIQVITRATYPFSLVSRSSFTLGSNDSEEISFRFSPRSTSDFEQEIIIKELYTNESKTLTLTGEGASISSTPSRTRTIIRTTGGDVAFNPDDGETLRFDDTVEDFSSERTIYVVNNTEDRAKVRMTNQPSGVFDLVGSRTLTLDEDEEDYFTIRFSPEKDKDYEDTIEIEVEGEDEDGDDFEFEVEIELRGEGIEIDNEDDPFQFNLSSETINPEADEKAYFNFFTETSADVDIEIFDNGDSIYEESFTTNSGRKDLDFFWDGEDEDGKKLGDDTYDYEVTIENEDDKETYTGEIRIDTDVDFDLTSSRRTITIEGFPRYPYFDDNIPDDIDEVTTDESLIFRLKATPNYVTKNNQDVEISLEATEDGRATVRVYNENLQRLLTIEDKDRLREGYHKNEYTWEDTEFKNEDARDGKYLIKVEFKADNGETDTDVVWVNLNRDGLLEDGQFDPPYPNYDNSYQEYYNEFEKEFGYTPSCEGFADVPENSFTCAAALYSFDKGIFTGNRVNNLVYLRLNEPMTRAEALAAILRIMGTEIELFNARYDGNLGFSDLNTKGWYAPYIKTMIKTATLSQARFGEAAPRILAGYPDGTLRPNAEINRAEFYKIIIEAAQNSENVRSNFNINYDLQYNPFQDVDADQWFAPYAHFASTYLTNSRYAARYLGSYSAGSTSGRFSGSAAITRGEVVDFIYELERQNLVQF